MTICASCKIEVERAVIKGNVYVCMECHSKPRACPVCDTLINDTNVARWGRLGTNEYNAIRMDAYGRTWCQSCVNVFDRVHWDDDEIMKYIIRDSLYNKFE